MVSARRELEGDWHAPQLRGQGAARLPAGPTQRSLAAARYNATPAIVALFPELCAAVPVGPVSGGWSIIEKLRALFVERGTDLAVAAHAQSESGVHTPTTALLDALACDPTKDDLSIFFGRDPDSDEEVEAGMSSLVGVPIWIQGGTGSGKTAALSAWLLSTVVPGARLVRLLCDFKGEFVPWWVTMFFPAELAAWPRADAEAFLADYRYINPFSDTALPPFNPLVPLPGVPASLQAREVTQLVHDSLGAMNNIGAKQEPALTYMHRLALDVGGLSFLECRSALVNGQYLTGLLRFCKDPEVREYFVYRFPKEGNQTVQGLASRLDTLLAVPSAQRVLCAPTTLDLHQCLASGTTLVDCGNAPRGAEYLTAYYAAGYLRGFTRAIMGRHVTAQTPPAIACFDEWQVGLDSDSAGHTERLLTQARFKKVTVVLANQLAAQIGGRYPQLLATLKNSCGLQVCFRQSHEDAATMSHLGGSSAPVMVPRVPGAAAWDVRPASADEARRIFVDRLSKMPDRHFMFAFRKRGLEAVELVAPTVLFDEARRAADAAPNWLKDACAGVGSGCSEAALDRVLERRRAHMALVAAGSATTAGPDFSARPADLVRPAPAAAPPPPSPVAAQEPSAPPSAAAPLSDAPEDDDLPSLG